MEDLGSPIVDVVVNSIGTRAASCCEESGAVRIWNLDENGSLTPLCTLPGHDSFPALRVAWAHHKFPGSPLLSCGVDGRVVLWKDTANTGELWNKAFEKSFNSPPTSIAWAPPEYGMMFAVGLHDGKVCVMLGKNQQWDSSTFDAHVPSGCNGLSWGPYLPPSGLLQMPLQQSAQSNLHLPAPRIVTCGNERSIRIWKYIPQDIQWLQEHELTEFPSNCIRDVAWAPSAGLPFSYIAVGSDEGHAVVWLQDGLDGRWKAAHLPGFDAAITRVSWSMVGTFLLVACANGSVTMWKEQKSGDWQLASTLCNE